MQILKSIGLGLLLIIVLLLIAGIFMPKEMSIERSIVINKPLPEVFNYIRFLKNQDKFSYWNMQDPNAKKEYKGTDGTVGFVYAWDSENSHVGKGSQTIASIDENRKMSFDLHFERPFKADDKSFMTTESQGTSSTRVTWSFEGVSKWPFNVMTPLMKGTLGDQLQTGLDNLKKNLESAPAGS